MELITAIRLIEKGIPHSTKQVWADLGAGKGLFTKALASLLGTGSTVIAVDTDSSALRSITLPSKDIILKKIQKDFTMKDLEMERLDGLVMANSLHFVNNKQDILQQSTKSLKTSGRIIVVEYDTDIVTPWVPYPVSYSALQKIASTHFNSISKIGETPSLFGRANIYSAILAR